MTLTESTAAQSQPGTRPYGHSVLASACAKWWRGAAVITVVVLANALVQAVLLVGDPTPVLLTWVSMTILALLSLVSLLIAGSLVASTALSVSAGHVSFKAATAKALEHFWLFTFWMVGWGAAVATGSIFYSYPGYLMGCATPFVLLAAADGQRNALGANFRAIGSRFGRFLVTLLATAVMLPILHLLLVVGSFFVTGAAGAFVVWFVFGLFLSWLAVAWALLYRATPVGAVAATGADATS